jgi:hypothetical protein
MINNLKLVLTVVGLGCGLAACGGSTPPAEEPRAEAAEERAEKASDAADTSADRAEDAADTAEGNAEKSADSAEGAEKAAEETKE